MTATPKPTRGGPRQNAGRPRKTSDNLSFSVLLPPEQVQWLETQGKRSQVIRRLIKQAMTEQPN